MISGLDICNSRGTLPGMNLQNYKKMEHEIGNEIRVII